MEVRCKYCNGTSFYEGPYGGLAMNILCANKDCRHWFNYWTYPFERMYDLNRIEPDAPVSIPITSPLLVTDTDEVKPKPYSLVRRIRARWKER
jgi:hypothetical protein